MQETSPEQRIGPDVEEETNASFDGYFSQTEAIAEIGKMPPAAWARISEISRQFARRSRKYDATQLVDEVLRRLAAETRHWPRHVEAIAFFYKTIESISGEEATDALSIASYSNDFLEIQSEDSSNITNPSREDVENALSIFEGDVRAQAFIALLVYSGSYEHAQKALHLSTCERNNVVKRIADRIRKRGWS